MKEIANTGLIVSVHHSFSTSANLEVFDISRKKQAKKIYSFEEVYGSRIIVNILSSIILFTSDRLWRRDLNPRRRILGAIPVTGEIAYHLFDLTTGKTGNIVKLIRKSRWHSQHSADEGT